MVSCKQSRVGTLGQASFGVNRDTRRPDVFDVMLVVNAFVYLIK